MTDTHNPLAFMLDRCYVLDESRQPVTAQKAGLTFHQWAERTFGDDAGRHVAVTTVNPDTPNQVVVSTVFLGTNMNHGLHEGAPLVFETMTFSHDAYKVIDRYTSWEEAEEGHAKTIKRLT